MKSVVVRTILVVAGGMLSWVRPDAVVEVTSDTTSVSTTTILVRHSPFVDAPMYHWIDLVTGQRDPF